MKIKPFRDGDTSATFRKITATVIGEIESLENDYVLKASIAELEEFYQAKVTVEPPVLAAASAYIKGQQGVQIDVSSDFRRGGFGDGRIVVKGTALTVAIPFTGEKNLLRLQASTFSHGGYPEIEIGEEEIAFIHQFPDDSPDSEEMKKYLERTIKSLSDAVSWLSADVAVHNAKAPEEIKAALARKRTKAAAATNAIAALGLPIKLRPDSATFAIPAKRRPSPLLRPVAPTGKFQPEPTIDQPVFEHVLQVLGSLALVIERSPGSFISLDEEGIRTHFLLQLNGHYEGLATGETFNASGKTDILVRVDNRNVFIAECKFWRGPKSFSDAIDQLLGYLSWRDSKCALLIFNQTKDSSSVLAKMHELMQSRPEHRRTVSGTAAGGGRYTFVKPTDPGREIQIQTMLFDFPKA